MVKLSRHDGHVLRFSAQLVEAPGAKLPNFFDSDRRWVLLAADAARHSRSECGCMHPWRDLMRSSGQQQMHGVARLISAWHT
jgi:hypothetical protein